MKLKVHAQRKFAQGAFIPPSASANTADRRVDVTPSKDENKNVYFNHMSAVSLLDMVAFKNMHTHTEPVVLLERLEEIQETIKDTPLPEINGGAKISPGAKNAMLAPPTTRNKPGRPFRYLQPKRTGGLNVVQRVQRPQNMHLRSRLGSSFKTRRPVKKKNRDKPNAVTRDLRRHRVPSPTESIYATDDEKPLTYIAQVLRRTVALRSDRNLRKRIGDELTSTSKRRARVPVPARTPKATKTSAQSGPSSKVTDRSSASDYDTDSGSIPSTPKQNATKPAPNQPAKPPSNASNGFKVNEGAGTSKQSESTQSPKEVENKSTLQEIAGSTLKPKPLPPVASSPSHTQTNLPSTRADKSKYQMRTEALSSMNRATRAERMMAIATAERGTQKRQVIPPKPHQISDTSYPSRRHATMKRVPHKVTVEELHRALEKACQSPPPSELDKPDAEAGPSKLRKKNCSESPPDPESTYNRKPEVESEPRRFRLEPTRPSAMARYKSISLGEMIKGKRNYEKYPVPLDTPPQFSDPEAGPSKVRKKKPHTTPDGPEEPIRISPDRDSPTPLVPPLRRKRTLLGMMRMRKRMNTPEPLRDGPFRKSPPKERSLLDIKSHDRPREPTQRQLDSAPKSVEHKAETPTKPTMSRLEPTIEPKSKPADIEIPADRIARCATSRRPIVEGWLKNVLYQQEDEKSPHFKVPRVPVARKSLERRPLKLSGNEREYNQTSAEPHLPAPIEIEDDPIEQPPKPAKFFTGRPRIHEFPCRENLPEPIIQPKNACLSKHYTTVRSIVHATDGELNDRCQHCVYCNRVDKIRKLSNLVQNQRKPATVPNEVYDFDADKEDSHENTRLYNFRQNRKAKILEPSKDGPKDPVYLDVLPPTNPHIIEITSVQMPNQSKPMLRARLIRKTDANLENEFSLIEHENLLDQLLEIKIANSDQTAKKNVTAPVEQTEEVAGPSNADAVQSDATDNTEDMELNYETDDSTEFLARLQTRLNTRKRAEQSNIRTKFGEKSGERSVEKSGGKSTEKTTEKVTEKLAEKLIEKLAEKLIEKAGEKSTEKYTEKPVEKSAEKSSDKSSVAKKLPRAEAKKPEPVKKTKTGLRKGHEETMRVELPKSYIMNHLNRCFREAPIFYPTEDEFLDPLAYFEKIYPVASQFGLCKVVAPAGFRPKCTITDDIRFNVANQYISRLYCRWGAASREMCAIKAYLAEQKVFFTRPPLIEGIELNLPKLYRTVQRHGGLKKVIEKKRWGRVAEDMRFPRGPRSAKRIDQLYVKHLLPYDTLSSAERRELMDTVENSWNRNYKKMLNRASNPLHRQKRLMGESESSDEMEDEDANLAYALAEAEDCVVTGRCMKLSVFKKVASNVLCTLFPNSELPSPAEVEAEYWALVAGATEHVCVNAASIDTGEEGYGFPRAKHDPLSRHPWNLKMFSQNSGNVLRSLGPVLGVTVPTLHLGMVFSTSCWHRDPHGLPWVEYMHQGPGKIWYGIPDELSTEFRKAVETLCPTSCQNKSIWLPSDITMIPPPLLHAARVPLSRVVQNPGEFIVVCPKAYSSSIATGYTESESVYFAPTQWLTDVTAVFQELRASCEPTMFSLEQLLLAVALDERVPAHVLAGVHANLRDVVSTELARRDQLMKYGVELATPEQYRLMNCNQARKRPAGAWNVREQDECEICRTTLYLSKVTGLTSKRSSLCLEHALLLLDKDRERYLQSVDGVVATFFVLHAELEDAVRRVKERMET
ncbi:uncharacterized protein LOC114363361 isoform X2 [Ostrinia furnacalis]|uniref:uncharacterized protein LOC114363361 isoform X2 n=1 Tax=Ostrinia furnacalis TaxID=93504 RepID=UPI00103BF7A0|nr:uncharacterized protein LOC114363361 isoform X2 [Ostrinia furnacalis]